MQLDNLQKFQEWVNDYTAELYPSYFDCDRSQQRQICLSLLIEEMGEAAKEMRKFEGRKYKGPEEASLESIEEELGDTFVILVKLFNVYGISVSDAVQRVVNKLEGRRENVRRKGSF